MVGPVGDAGLLSTAVPVPTAGRGSRLPRWRSEDCQADGRGTERLRGGQATRDRPAHGGEVRPFRRRRRKRRVIERPPRARRE